MTREETFAAAVRAINRDLNDLIDGGLSIILQGYQRCRYCGSWMGRNSNATIHTPAASRWWMECLSLQCRARGPIGNSPDEAEEAAKTFSIAPAAQPDAATSVKSPIPSTDATPGDGESLVHADTAAS